MAVDLLPEDRRSQVHIADAPLVEGGIAAALEASIGGTVQSVLERAAEARQISKLN